MRTTIPLESWGVQVKTSRKLLPAPVPNPLAVLATAAAMLAVQLFLCAQPVAAQTAAASPASTTVPGPAHKAHHPHTRPSASPPLTPPVATTFAPIPAPAPAPPLWPANDLAAQASVVWDSRGLRIDAQNSSLQQILNDFSTATGTKVEGMATDERVFGVFGPGQARDVLSQLLQGSGYNILMIGDQGQGTPRQIVLSARHAGDAQPAPAGNPSSSDDDADTEEPQQPPQAAPAPFRPGFPPRTPQQINAQEQQRQQQQQQQQQQQNNNPPN
jgi:hypothetical protein